MARFLTYQEIQTACNKTDMFGEGLLDSCNWLLENIGRYEVNSGSYGYWLETPQNGTAMVYLVSGSSRGISGTYANVSSYGYGVRPVITVKTSNLG